MAGQRGRGGNDEIAPKKLTVTIRKKSQPNKPFKEQMTSDALIAAVKKDVEGKQFRPLYTLRKLSMKARYIWIFFTYLYMPCNTAGPSLFRSRLSKKIPFTCFPELDPPP